MTKIDILREITPLSREDCFLVIHRPKPGFYYPLHLHSEFELNYLQNVKGALRIVGDSVEEMDEYDLILVAGGTKHAYSNHKCACVGIYEITVQFMPSLFDSMIDKRQFKSIKDMFENASSGIVFSRDVVVKVQEELKSLSNDAPDSFSNFIKLIQILKILSLDQGARRLNARDSIRNYNQEEADRLECIMRYLHENYHLPIQLADLASLMNMSESSLTRFLKKWTGKTFVDNLNDIRIAEAVNRLIDSSDSVSEICYKCGFNNISNFNRVFKRRKENTPSEYREKYARTRFKV
ncbi:AraC family transcriptional regulator [Parabacteroides sp. OttesenSCG-928-N08]|nr:AraC family transcriptional regulator [Parabacteroides sp. OttesenSCG-928-N08]